MRLPYGAARMDASLLSFAAVAAIAVGCLVAVAPKLWSAISQSSAVAGKISPLEARKALVTIDRWYSQTGGVSADVAAALVVVRSDIAIAETPLEAPRTAQGASK